ncbi:uncharacterized protein AMSG_00998 [Thecamonas trahens ATCC 50062]|uniref:Uncharacterized protein n=1 Tax=Thecamonas trahens ATCC 50062 TaxID=461836 RepID=A0A0L0DIP8_THETB|nr:hypothetical protein AMSG_00998 [Thecamonas trahens ATCC 50062]KNC52172.1 hypothetical protein AMSG_00998 [Thecamonas trahens ATCC 50062]|eukprot:XP_013762175.1 hypothetical protein AMSG_00998 [Thecamonas trahens ATCC 50062]
MAARAQGFMHFMKVGFQQEPVVMWSCILGAVGIAIPLALNSTFTNRPEPVANINDIIRARGIAQPEAQD